MVLSPLAALATALLAPPDYAAAVQPVFARHCVSCHGEAKQIAGLRLDSPAAVRTGGDSGPVLKPGVPADAELVRRMLSADKTDQMPPKGPRVTPTEITSIQRWILTGAVVPAPANAGPKLWSLRPVVKPRPPAAGHPVDAFVNGTLANAGLTPAPDADRRTLLRRAYFDLTGLPPTFAEVQAFVADTSPQAFETRVEKLLASREHGERYARHWLDLVRFAETHGFEMNQERPTAWPYRDYVIKAFAENLPFDKFVRDQLAGDATGADAATGFLVAGAWDQVKSPDPVLTANQRADELHDMVSVVGSAFLGLTVGCARCHAHKFDPIPQTDYFAVRAVFEGVSHGERAIPRSSATADAAEVARLRTELRTLDASVDAAEPLAGGGKVRPAVTGGRNVDRFAPRPAKFVRFTITKTNNLEPCIDELEVFTAGADPRNVALAAAGAKVTSAGNYPGHAIHTLAHATDGRYGNDRSWISDTIGRGRLTVEFPSAVVVDRVVWSRDRTDPPRFRDRTPTEYTIEVSVDGKTWETVATAADRAAFGTAPPANSLAAKRTIIANELAALTRPATAYAGTMSPPPPTRRLHRGDPTQPREVIPPGALTAVPVAMKTPAGEPARRLAFADWVVDPRNPLTPRVVVNRLWMWHFGEGLVSTPGDFGANGSPPSHPELLDFLAAELVEHGWDLRHVHRLILSSAAYRRSSAGTPAGLAADAGSRLLWRFPPRRLEAEAVRDSVLAASGELDLSPGGPGFSTFEPNANYVRVYTPKTAFAPEDFRRMVYMTKVRMQAEPTFGAFDCPDAGQVAPKRTRSTTPLQALNLFNGPFVVGRAAAFASRVRAEAGDDPLQQVRAMFRVAVQRDPDAAEMARCLDVVRAHGLGTLARAVFNANEFLFLE